MYHLSELLQLTETKVNCEPMDSQLALCVCVWQKSSREQEEQIRDHASVKIQPLMPAVESSTRDMASEKDELVTLFSESRSPWLIR